MTSLPGVQPSRSRPPFAAADTTAAALRRLAEWGRASEGRQGRGLALLAIVVYVPACLGGFVSDDWIFVTEPLIRRLDGIVSIWLSPSEIPREDHYWPVVYTSFWIEHKLWGFNPVGYHAVNVALHALNSVLLWRLLLRLSVPGAWLVAAVFAVHPVHVESVAWIIERKDLLSTAFYLGAVHAWLRFTRAPGAGRYLLCLALFVAALLSKSIAVTLPAALVLLQWWREGRVTLRDVARLAPLFAVALGITLADLAFYRSRIDYAFDYSLVERALIAARALWVYAWQLVWPAYLPVLHPRWEVRPGDPLGWLALGALAALGAALWLARHRIGRGPLAGVLFFALTLSPVLGFLDFSFMRFSFVADRFQYLASVGPLAVLVGGAVHRAARLRAGARARAGAIAAAAVVVAALGALGWRQCGVYLDDLTFARHTVARTPQHYIGHTLLSHELSAVGRHEEALAAARRAVDLSEGRRGIDPGAAYLALGGALLAQDRPVEAEAALRQALAQWPRARRAGPRLQLARSLVRQARYEEGLARYRALLADEPHNDLAHFQMGLAFLEAGRLEAAVDSFGQALAVVRHLDDEPAMHVRLGEALHRLGRHEAAATHLDRALELDPGNVRILLARVDLERDRQLAERADGLLAGAGERAPGQGGEAQRDAGATRIGAWLAQARERCEALVEHAPEHALARVVLGAVLLRMEEHDAATAALEEALALGPRRPVAREAHRLLGEVLEKRGRIEAAARHYRHALDIDPLDAEALERLGGLRLREGRYADALPLYRRLVDATPFAAQAHVQLGATLHHLGRLDEALPAVARARELAPGLEAARELEARISEAIAAAAAPDPGAVPHPSVIMRQAAPR